MKKTTQEPLTLRRETLCQISPMRHGHIRGGFAEGNQEDCPTGETRGNAPVYHPQPVVRVPS